MSNFWVTFGGCLVGLLMIVFGVMLAFMGGTFLDQMEHAALDAHLDMGVGTEWDATGQVAFFRNLFYAICIAIPLLGLFIMYISITWKMRYDQYQQDYSYEEY